MKILIGHNYYRQRGGEDVAFENESNLLESAGHEVIRFTRHNEHLGPPATMVREAIWSTVVYQRLRELLERERPEIAHFHNTLPQLSSSVFKACRDANVPVAQTLHNYRLTCANAMLYRHGQVCERCIKGAGIHGVRKACYRGSRSASAVIVAGRLYARWRGHGARPHRYFVLNEFMRGKLAEAGIPNESMVVKPNCLTEAPAVGSGSGSYAVYVGRLSEEKGVDLAIAAWKELGENYPLRLKVVGKGPQGEYLKTNASDNIDFLGHCKPDRVRAIIADAAFLVLPSRWYEGSPMTLIEAYAVGTPVVGADIGSLSGLVDEGTTGSLFAPGDAGALARAARALVASSIALSVMRKHCRDRFEREFSPSCALPQLLGAYRKTIRAAERPAHA